MTKEEICECGHDEGIHAFGLGECQFYDGKYCRCKKFKPLPTEKEAGFVPIDELFHAEVPKEPQNDAIWPLIEKRKDAYDRFLSGIITAEQFVCLIQSQDKEAVKKLKEFEDRDTGVIIINTGELEEIFGRLW